METAGCEGQNDSGRSNDRQMHGSQFVESSQNAGPMLLKGSPMCL